MSSMNASCDKESNDVYHADILSVRKWELAVERKLSYVYVRRYISAPGQPDIQGHVLKKNVQLFRKNVKHMKKTLRKTKHIVGK